MVDDTGAVNLAKKNPSIFLQPPEAATNRRNFTRYSLTEILLNHGEVFCMDHLAKRHVVCQFFHRIAEHVRELRIDIFEDAVLGKADAHQCLLCKAFELVLGFPQCSFDPFAFRQFLLQLRGTLSDNPAKREVPRGHSRDCQGDHRKSNRKSDQKGPVGEDALPSDNNPAAVDIPSFFVVDGGKALVENAVEQGPVVADRKSQLVEILRVAGNPKVENSFFFNVV